MSVVCALPDVQSPCGALTMMAAAVLPAPRRRPQVIIGQWLPSGVILSLALLGSR